MQLKKKDFSPQNIFQIWHYFRFLVYKRNYKSTDVSLSSGSASRGVIRKIRWDKYKKKSLQDNYRFSMQK